MPHYSSQREPALTERYDMRMDADLKAWIKANGGDRMIRDVLRALKDAQEQKQRPA